jgi:hypothetical protein
MPPIQAIAPTFCFREMSPEVPEEMKAQLHLGEPPDDLKDKAHPIARLLWQNSKNHHASIPFLARAIGGEKNLNKSIRRIEQIFSGERLLPFWIENLVTQLAITSEELANAKEKAIVWKAERDSFELRRDRHRSFSRLGPYLRALIVDANDTSIPPTLDVRPRIYSDVFSIPGDPELSDVSSWIASKANFLGSDEIITGYLYHRYPEEIYFFDREGEILAKGNAATVY